MQSLVGGVFVVLGLILASGLLALAESALGSARKSRLRDWSSRGDRGAEAALRLSEDPKGFLRTVQAVITLLVTLAGVYGGATLEPELGRAIEQFRPAGAYRAAIGLGAVVLGITLATPRPGRICAASHRAPPARADRQAGGAARPGPGDLGQPARRVVERRDGSGLASRGRSPGTRTARHRGRDLRC